jgi:multiple sugar transport system substrate-binding protein
VRRRADRRFADADHGARARRERRAVGNAKLGGTLSILQWSHFVPDFDTYLDTWAKTWGTKYGVDVKIDRTRRSLNFPR